MLGGQRTKEREEDSISHLGGIRYYSQRPLVTRRERKEKPEERHNIMLNRIVRHKSNNPLTTYRKGKSPQKYTYRYNQQDKTLIRFFVLFM